MNKASQQEVVGTPSPLQNGFEKGLQKHAQQPNLTTPLHGATGQEGTKRTDRAKSNPVPRERVMAKT
jgi:hypothetical protein